MGKKPKKERSSAPDFAFIYATLPQNLRKGDRTKIAILEATVESLAKHGLANTTFETIARQCKLRQSLVIYHFPEKGVLIDAAVRFVFAKSREFFSEHMAKAATPRGKLIALIESNFEWFEKFPSYRSVELLSNYLCSIDPNQSQRYRDHKNTGRRKIIEMIGEEIYRQGLSLKDAEQIATDFHNIVTGYLDEYACSALSGEVGHLLEMTKRAAINVVFGPKGSPARK